MQYNQDSKFWHFATLVADFILLNLLFIFLCIPIITIGPALAALMHTTLKLSEDENRTLVNPFWNEFKRDITKKMLASMDRIFSSNCCYGLYGSILLEFC